MNKADGPNISRPDAVARSLLRSRAPTKEYSRSNWRAQRYMSRSRLSPYLESTGFTLHDQEWDLGYLVAEGCHVFRSSQGFAGYG